MYKESESICIVGAGSWATALCKIFSDTGRPVNWWYHRPDDAAHFMQTGRNPRYLSDVDFSGKNITAFSNLKEVIGISAIILVVVPSAYAAQVLDQLPQEAFESKTVITSVKGIIPVHLQLLSNYIHDRFSVHTTNSAVIAGPCHAEEVALEKQSYLTVASANPELALQIRELMQNRYISVNLSGDPEGVEWAAILKNVYAIACGVCHGLGFGDNFQAVLVANAMQEMQLFLDCHLPASRNTLDSAYLGDLLVTAYSTFSRNRTFGNMIGRGYNVRAAEMELGMVAEGYHAVRALHQLREKLQIRLPIADAMHAVLYENAPVSSKIMELRGILS